MQTLSNKLRSVIEDQLRSATPRQILSIASALCTEEIEVAQTAASPASPRFEIRDDTVLDRRTGIMWTRGNVPGGRMSWTDAQKAASAVSLGGYSDWRLPTIRELLSIVAYERHSPAIDIHAFECESAWYWSSTPYAPSPGVCAWYVGFFGGGPGCGARGDCGFVRACRSGQSVEHWF